MAKYQTRSSLPGKCDSEAGFRNILLSVNECLLTKTFARASTELPATMVGDGSGFSAPIVGGKWLIYALLVYAYFAATVTTLPMLIRKRNLHSPHNAQREPGRYESAWLRASESFLEPIWEKPKGEKKRGDGAEGDDVALEDLRMPYKGRERSQSGVYACDGGKAGNV